MHHTNDERTRQLVEADAADMVVEPGLRRLIVAVSVRERPVAVAVTVHVVAVLVRMRVLLGALAELVAHVLHEGRQIPESEHHQHERDRHLHRQADCGRDHHTEEDDGASDDGDREGMAHAPQTADQDAGPQPSLSRDDRADGDDVIRVRGMTHAEQEAERNHGGRCHAAHPTSR